MGHLELDQVKCNMKLQSLEASSKDEIGNVALLREVKRNQSRNIVGGFVLV